MVSSGDSFRIFNQDHEGYLSVSSRDISDFLPAELDIGAQMVEEKAQCSLFLPKFEKPEEKARKLKVFIEKDKTGRSLWELERINPFIGGIALAEEVFKIKHVGTGMYLEMDFEGKIELKSDPISEFNVFRFLPTSVQSHQLNFNTHLQIHNRKTELFLGSSEKETLNSYLMQESQESSTKVSVKAYKEDKNLINTTFILIDVPESSTIHIYQISRVLLKILEFYSFLQK